MWKSGKKIKVCKYCGEEGHTPFQCSKRKIDKSLQQKEKKPAKKRQPSERSLIIHDLDRTFSELLRKEQRLAYGYNYCEVCGKRLDYPEACIGHYLSRRYIGTRFSRENVLIICRECNMPGQKQKSILNKMGYILSKKYENFWKVMENKTYKPSTQELKEMREFYSASLSSLQIKERMVKL